MSGENKIEEDILFKDDPIAKLQKRVRDIEGMLGMFNPRNLAGLSSADLQYATRKNFFGDGSDGNVIITGTTTLTRDMYYKNLTVNNGGILITASFRVFVQEDLIINSGGIIKNSGTDGGNGGTQYNPSLGGTAGTAISGGSLPGALAGAAGGDGNASNNDPGVAGTSGSDAAKSLSVAGVGGGAGGTGGEYSGGNVPGTGGNGGNGGSITGTVYNVPRSYTGIFYLLDTQPSIASFTTGASSGGGGGGGSGDYIDLSPGWGGGGGASGSCGGIIWIAASSIINYSTEGIQAKGGNGGNGGKGQNASSTGNASGGGGGGGGGGGTGGVRARGGSDHHRPRRASDRDADGRRAAPDRQPDRPRGRDDRLPRPHPCDQGCQP